MILIVTLTQIMQSQIPAFSILLLIINQFVHFFELNHLIIIKINHNGYNIS